MGNMAYMSGDSSLGKKLDKWGLTELKNDLNEILESIRTINNRLNNAG
jgi:hypothetical protein